MRMITPWMGVLGALAAVAAMPAVAAAQAPDTTGPAIAITAPADGATYVVGQPVQASYACSDDSGIADCVGTVPSGSVIDTGTAGPGVFTVTSHDKAGNASSASRNYTVVVQDPGPVGGDAPATLALTLGTVTPFAGFLPGVGKDYTTSMTAHIVSSAADATLTAADPSAVDSGHLVNGPYFLPQPLLAAAASATGTGTAALPVNSTADPTRLETWAGPANEDVTLTFTQPIGGGDVLRTGSYAKTLVFTLSTTNP
jgi:hypothetical protein